MKKVLPVLILTLSASLLNACRSDSDAVPDTTDTFSDTTSAQSVSVSDITTMTHTASQNTTTSPDTLSSLTEATVSASDTTILSSTNSETTLPTDEPQAHGDTPYPTYFNYRFSPDGITVRLSGGNYQSLHLDLSEAIDHNLDFLYRLEDFNFDGNPDLVVPVQFGTSNVLYGVLIWNPDTAQFHRQPIHIFNPNVHPAEKKICARISESPAIQSLEIYTWNQDQLELRTKYSADYEACTLTTIALNPESEIAPEIQTFSSADELESKFLSLH